MTRLPGVDLNICKDLNNGDMNFFYRAEEKKIRLTSYLMSLGLKASPLQVMMSLWEGKTCLGYQIRAKLKLSNSTRHILFSTSKTPT